MARPLSCFFVTIQTEAETVYRVVDDTPFTIGRTVDSALALSDSNIGKIHLIVRNKSGKVWIEDQGSVNGTFVNGKRLDSKKLTPIDSKDLIVFGSTNIRMWIALVEKAFTEKIIDESDLPAEERESLANLISGAYAEAQRLSVQSKENYDHIIQTAKDLAKKIESDMVTQRELVLRDASQKGADLIEQARQNGDQAVKEMIREGQKAVEGIHKRAEEVRLQADEYRKDQVAAAKVDADEIRKECDKAVEAMNRRADEIREQAEEYRKEQIAAAKADIEEIKKVHEQRQTDKLKEVEKQIERLHEINNKEVEDIKKRAHKEADAILQEARVEGDRRAKELVESMRVETKKKLELFSKEENEKIALELECRKSVVESEIKALRLEGKKQQSDLMVEITSLKTEHSRLSKEVEEQKGILEKRKKVFEDELAHKKELKEREAQVYFDTKKREIETMGRQKSEEIEKLKKSKEEEAQVFVRSKNLEYEKLKQTYEAELADLQKEIEKLTPEVKKKREEFKVLEKQLAETSSKYETLKPQYKKITEDIDKDTFKKNELQVAVKDLEAKRGHLTLDLESMAGELKALKASYDSQLSRQKSDLEAEISKMHKAQMDELDQQRLAEIERFNKAKAELVEDLLREKKNISLSIYNAVEAHAVKIINANEWRKIADKVKNEITHHLEEKSMSLLASENSKYAGAMINKNQKRMQRWNGILQGIVLGAIFYHFGQIAYVQFQQDANPMQTAAAEKAREAQEDLERRKFNPPQDNELRDSYANSVIYTKDFVINYLDQEFQNKWLKSISLYFLKQWKVEEEKTIEALSVVNTLIKTLDEKKQAIHPDYVKDGLKKMDDLEAETVTRLIEILGSEVRYEAFRKQEKKFYLDHFQSQSREPAKEGDAVEELDPIDSEK